MVKKIVLAVAFAAILGAAFLGFRPSREQSASLINHHFVTTRGSRFMIGGEPFRFVGANVAIMYRDEDRQQMPETLRQAAQAGIGVIRVWAFGEGGPQDVGPVGEDAKDWPRHHPFRWAPDQWNEAALVHLDRVLAEAARNNLRVQLCLTNWWRDTGGITQYLRWAGIDDAADDSLPYGINPERAMLFYTNDETRRFYREHLEKLATRRNTVTGVLYRDDPVILGWELMNEAQAQTGRWDERRAWIAEMSAYLRSLAPNHLITPGVWGYRSAAERREWLADHRLPNVDYCDVHNYPKDDLDSFVDSPTALREFVENRVAAASLLNKPLVLGEFGMNSDGYNGFSQREWFYGFFNANLRSGAAGAMFWILTPDQDRGYGITYTSRRDAEVLDETRLASERFRTLGGAELPSRLTEQGRHLVPRQFVFARSENDPSIVPETLLHEDKTLLYRFKPNMNWKARFEKMGSGPGYIWGSGVGFVEYRIPAREDRRRVSHLIVRAHIQPVLPIDAKPEQIKTRVTLFVNDTNCGSRIIPVLNANNPLVQEWRVDSFLVRLQAMRGLPLRIRFAVTPESDWLYGVNISNWPEGYDSQGAKPLEIEIRR